MGSCASVDSTRRQQRSGAYRSGVNASAAAEDDKQQQEEAYKLLLLGCSDAGKSTLFKQFMLLLTHNTLPAATSSSATASPSAPAASTTTTVTTSPFSPEVHRAYVSAISRNVLQSMRTLLIYSLKLDVAHRTRFSSQLEPAAEAVRNFTFSPLQQQQQQQQQPSSASPSSSSPSPAAAAVAPLPPVDKLPSDLLQHLRSLWNDEGIQRTYNLRSMFDLSDNVAYFFSRLDEYALEDYCPSFQDLLQARARTVGLVQSSMLRSDNALTSIPAAPSAEVPEIGGSSCTYFQFIDSGGRRADRRNWFHALNASMVRGVFFVVNLSEYDRTVPEDPRMNRMAESLALWTEVVNSRFLYKEPIVLLLNKVDLFREKLISRRIPLTTAFPDYIPSSSDVSASALPASDQEDHAIAFIKKQFEERHEFAGKKQVYIHVVNALDLNTVQHAFQVVKPIILKSAQQRI